MNYGAIGFVIGHEITHGFDDQGRQFDKEGNLVDWWEPETKMQYLKRAECIIYQYGNYTVKEVGMNVRTKTLHNIHFYISLRYIYLFVMQNSFCIFIVEIFETMRAKLNEFHKFLHILPLYFLTKRYLTIVEQKEIYLLLFLCYARYTKMCIYRCCKNMISIQSDSLCMPWYIAIIV